MPRKTHYNTRIDIVFHAPLEDDDEEVYIDYVL